MREPLALLLLAIGACALAACSGGDDDASGTNYPSAGDDRFERTSATVQIEVARPQASIAGGESGQLETVRLEGPALIRRSDPVRDGDVYVVNTEIIEMELRGDSAFGPVIVRESATKESKGEVRQQETGNDFPAASFFDVFIEAELPDMDLTLHNEEPMRMTSTLRSLPPEDGEEYRGEDERPLYTPAGIEVGRIVDALHIPAPEAGGGGGGGSEDDEDLTATAVAAKSRAPTETPIAPETTPTPVAAITTAGGCVHGQGQSVLHIVFRGLTPGQRLRGNVVQGPPDGLIGEGTFDVTADANGEARLQKDIKKLGTYAWVADGGIAGNFTVSRECPGVP